MLDLLLLQDRAKRVSPPRCTSLWAQRLSILLLPPQQVDRWYRFPLVIYDTPSGNGPILHFCTLHVEQLPPCCSVRQGLKGSCNTV